MHCGSGNIEFLTEFEKMPFLVISIANLLIYGVFILLEISCSKSNASFRAWSIHRSYKIANLNTRRSILYVDCDFQVIFFCF